MKDQSAYLFLNRKQAAQQLISQLWDYKNKNCSIVAISNGAVVMGKYIAEQLNADLVFAPSERIIDPANQRRSIGVVGFDYMMIFSGISPRNMFTVKQRCCELSFYPDIRIYITRFDLDFITRL